MLPDNHPPDTVRGLERLWSLINPEHVLYGVGIGLIVSWGLSLFGRPLPWFGVAAVAVALTTIWHRFNHRESTFAFRWEDLRDLALGIVLVTLLWWRDRCG